MKKRLITNIDDKYHQKLKQEAQLKGITLNALVCDIVQHYYAEKNNTNRSLDFNTLGLDELRSLAKEGDDKSRLLAESALRSRFRT